MALFNKITKLGRFSNLASVGTRSATAVPIMATDREHQDHHLPDYRAKIGNREVVGPSPTGREEYFDLKLFPCPPIRYKEPTAQSDALREKEKGDWKLLTVDEKKALYRYSFCQTFAEFEASTPEWKYILGNTLLLLCVPIMVYIIAKKTVFPPLPDTLSDENKKKVVRFYIDNQVDPIEGFASKWDYEKNEWKKKPFWFIKKKNE